MQSRISEFIQSDTLTHIIFIFPYPRAGQIHSSWAEEGSASVPLWPLAWCPLLQGTARLCCDKRSHIRTSALSSLQRALLFRDLHAEMGAREWESAFAAVLFPMLDQLLLRANPGEKTAMEETRTRAATLLGKVFLQHLSPLSSLRRGESGGCGGSFPALWATVLDLMRRFIAAASSDLLADAVPELLKNMLLVMDTAGLFFVENGGAGRVRKTELCTLTEERLKPFLPELMGELFGRREVEAEGQQQQQQMQQTQQQPQPKQPGSSGETSVPEAPAPDKDATTATASAAAPPPLPVTEAHVPPSASSDAPPPPSPLDPPVLAASAFAPPQPQAQVEETQQQHGQAPATAAAASATVPPAPLPAFSLGRPSSLLPTSALRSSTAVTASPIRIPSLPEIAPMPPPPIPVGAAPIATAAVTGGVSANFQPIHVPPPLSSSSSSSPTKSAAPVPPPPVLANPTPVLASPTSPPPFLPSAAAPGAANPQIASYFSRGDPAAAATAAAVSPPPAATPGVGLAGNILAQAFSPTIPNPVSTVFLSTSSSDKKGEEKTTDP